MISARPASRDKALADIFDVTGDAEIDEITQ